MRNIVALIIVLLLPIISFADTKPKNATDSTNGKASDKKLFSFSLSGKNNASIITNFVKIPFDSLLKYNILSVANKGLSDNKEVVLLSDTVLLMPLKMNKGINIGTIYYVLLEDKAEANNIQGDCFNVRFYQ